MGNSNFYLDENEDILYSMTPIDGTDGVLSSLTPVMSKDAFIACYNAWIKDNQDEDDRK